METADGFGATHRLDPHLADIGGDPGILQRAAMMGGIVVATVLTILVLPAGYALFFGREPKKVVNSEQAPEPELATERPQLALAAE